MNGFGAQPTDAENLRMATERMADMHRRMGDLLELSNRLLMENAGLRLDLQADNATIKRLREQVAKQEEKIEDLRECYDDVVDRGMRVTADRAWNAADVQRLREQVADQAAQLGEYASSDGRLRDALKEAHDIGAAGSIRINRTLTIARQLHDSLSDPRCVVARQEVSEAVDLLIATLAGDLDE